MNWITEHNTQIAKSDATSWDALAPDVAEWLQQSVAIAKAEGLKRLWLFADVLYGSFDTVLHDEKYDAPGKGIVMMRCPWVEESYDKAVPEPEEDEFDAAHAEFFQKVVDVVRTAMPKGQIDVELTLASCPETAEKGIRIA